MKRLILPALLAACNQEDGDIEGVKRVQNEGDTHQEGRITDAQTPSAGGPHHPGWQNCGVYDRPLYDEYAVHSLEYGAGWLTSRLDLPTGQLEALKKLVEGRPYTVLSSHETQLAPLVLSAWNKPLEVQAVSDPRVKSFLQKDGPGGEAPEIGALCSGTV
ncbi:DUF3105 domain-containing protein [Deinococcus humi]|uniref:DUF3105 domain-containing protein n=1 Tax=Deinococcus humi TaxID=662880 RepID=A0A7W8JZH0_9DEIO|nr:DUF3105 domain-containing protein [Deinococcus humi]MBB5364464.1 hypothetical protein [Deinococcus humi]GGO33014.1 hypothetical protein GCM10008949_31570 [Deinococcus humi]